MKKLEKRIVNSWYETIEDTDKFLDFAEHVNLNSFKSVDGVRCVLFENGMNYTVDTVMKETDGEKEKEIIEQLSECGVDFDEVSSDFLKGGK